MSAIPFSGSRPRRRTLPPLRPLWLLYLVFALLLCGRTASAQIVSADVSPALFAATGGSATLTVKIDSTFPVSYIYAYQNGGGIGYLSSAGVAPDGTQTYTLTFNVPANTTSQARTFAYTFTAYSPNGQTLNGSAGTVDVGAPAPLTLTNTALSVQSLSANGGSVTVTTTAIVTAPNAVSNLVIYGNGNYYASLTPQSTNADGSVNYAATFSLPSNISDAPKSNLFVLTASDSAGNTAPVVAGTVTVAPVTAVGILSVSTSANTIAAAGDSITVNAVLNIPAPNTISSVIVYRAGSNQTSLALQSTNPDGTKNYSGTFALPANNSLAARAGSIFLRVTDAAGNTIAKRIGDATVSAATPVSLVSASISTDTLSAAGGSLTFNATLQVAAPNNVSTYLYLYQNGNYIGGLSYTDTNADGTRNYAMTYADPANYSNVARVENYTFTAPDSIGDTLTVPIGTVTIAALPKTSIVSAALSTNSLPFTGGAVTVSAIVSVPAPNTLSGDYLYLYDNGSYTDTLAYTDTNADGTRNYSVSHNVASNLTQTAYQHNYSVYLSDRGSNVRAMPVGTLTVVAATPLTLVSASLSTSALPATGGSVTATATVAPTAPNTVSPDYLSLYANTGVVNYLQYVDSNADGSRNYAITFNIGANTGQAPLVTNYTVRANDRAGNAVYSAVLPLTEAAAAPLSLVSKTLSATDLPATGGAIVFTATLKVNAPLNIPNYYYSRLSVNGGVVGYPAYVDSNPDGSLNFAYTYNVGANNTLKPLLYSFTYQTMDSGGNVVTAPAGTVTEAAAVPASLVSVALSTHTAPATGGSVTITATTAVAAPNYISPDYLYLYVNGSVYDYLRYVDTNADGSRNYAYTQSIGANNATVTRAYNYLVEANDALGSHATAVAGTLTQDAAAPITLVSASLSDTTLTAAGGAVTLRATVAAPAPNYASPDYLYAYINGGVNYYLYYVDSNADGSRNYATTANVGGNNSTTPRKYNFTITANDSLGNTIPQSVGTLTEAAAAPLQFTAAALSTNSLPAAGGPVTVTATLAATAPNAVTAYYLYLYRNGGIYDYLRYVDTNADGSRNYAATVNLPAASTAQQKYTFTIAALDNAGYTVYNTFDPVTVGTGTVGSPIQIKSSSLSVSSLPAVGGSAIVTAKIGVAAPNTVSMLRVYRNGADSGALIYQNTDADGNRVYATTLSYNANINDIARSDIYTLYAADSGGNVALGSVGTVTQAAVTPIQIVSAALSARSFPAKGGDFIITATVSAPAPLTVSEIYVTKNGGNVAPLTYQSANADGTLNYTGTFTDAVNNYNSVRADQYALRVSDSVGNRDYAAIGTVTTAAPVPFQITASALSVTSLPATGGTVAVTATLKSVLPVRFSAPSVYVQDGPSATLTQTGVNADGSVSYFALLTLPANATPLPLQNIFFLRASDTVGNTSQRTLGTVKTAAAASVSLLSSSISAASFSATGGNITLTAKVRAVAPTTVSQVYAYLDDNNLGALNYQSTSPDGSLNYAATFSVAANPYLQDRQDYYSLAVTDNLHDRIVKAFDVVTTRASIPLTIVSATTSATTFPAAGGAVTLTAKINAPAPNSVSTVYVLLNGTYITTLAYQSTNADSSLNYANTLTVAANLSPKARNDNYAIFVTDRYSDQSYQAFPVVTVSASSALSIVSASESAASFPAAGGVITLSAVINAPTPNVATSVYAYLNGANLGSLTYQSTNADGTQNYAADFTVTSNLSRTTRSDLYTISATDSLNVTITQTLNPVVTAQAGAASVISGSLSATSLSAAGDNLFVSAVVTAPAPNYVSNIAVYRNGIYIGALSYLYPNGDGSGNYVGNFPLPANSSVASNVGVYTLGVSDAAGNFVPYSLGTVTQAGATAVSLVSAAVSKSLFPAVGGDLMISATVNTPYPLYTSSVTVYQNGVNLGALDYQSTNPDGTANYSHTFPDAANNSDLARSDLYTLAITDNLGNLVDTTLATVTTAPTTPISFTQSTVSTTSLTATGGDVTLHVVTNAPLPNSVSFAGVALNGPSAQSLVYQSTNADGTFNYAATFTLPANVSVNPQSYLFTLTAGDTAGNVVTAAIDPVMVDRTTGAVAGRVTLEGEVSNAAPQTLIFEFRPKDGTPIFQRAASVGPDGFFNFDVPRKNYSLWIKGPKNLAKLVQANTLNSNTHNVTALLPGGDATNDNFCDANDFGVFVSAYNTDASIPGSGYDPTADFNGDGSVDATDFGILVGNYNTMGDL